MTTCLTPGCEASVDYNHRCNACWRWLWRYSARGYTLPWHETPPRLWADMTEEERKRP